jgi:hypothetical protein
MRWRWMSKDTKMLIAHAIDIFPRLGMQTSISIIGQMSPVILVMTRNIILIALKFIDHEKTLYPGRQPISG